MNFLSLSLTVVAFDILSDDYSKVSNLGLSYPNSLLYDLYCYVVTLFNTYVVCKCIVLSCHCLKDQ